MYQYLAYIPYAAVGYCAAKVATDVWPSLRSQLGSLSHFSSRHGADGEAYGPRSGSELGYCPPGGGAGLGPSNLTAGARRNQVQAYVAQSSPGYCYDEDSGQLTGSGPLAGVTPPAATVSIWIENGQRVATVHMGDNEITVPTCAQPGGGPPRTGGGGGPGDCDPRTGEPRSGDPRAGGQPMFRQAQPCEPTPWGRGSDGGRLARKRNRWG